MSSFKHMQRKRGSNSTRPAPISPVLHPSRPFMPLPTSAAEPAHSSIQEQLERTARFGHSFERISLFPSEKKNTAGLPDSLKAGIEDFSGISLDDVHVHYNSAKPAQVGALAYTQGTDIQVGPGQEAYLAHEAWHAVQQKQGRVEPTMQAKGTAINDDEELEEEADAIGKQVASSSERPSAIASDGMLEKAASVGNVIQLGKKKEEKKGKGKKKKKEKLAGTKRGRLEEGNLAEEQPHGAMQEEGAIPMQEEEDIPIGEEQPHGAMQEEEEVPIEIDAATQQMIDNPAGYTLAEIAQAIHHVARGSPNANTTGIGRLSNGTLVLATQLPLSAPLRQIAQLFHIQRTYKTLDAGYHVETTLYIVEVLQNGNELAAVGASQGFCPDCQKFLETRRIRREGPNRGSDDQVWYSPEYYEGREKDPIDAAYPWAYELDEVIRERFEYRTRGQFKLVEAVRLKGINSSPADILEQYSAEYLNANGSLKVDEEDLPKTGSIADLGKSKRERKKTVKLGFTNQ